MIYIGIDPGLISGAWGAISHDGQYVGCGSIPNDGSRVIPAQFKEDILRMLDERDCSIVSEDVFSLPGQGHASSFKFGRAVGVIEAVCQALPGPWFIVHPKRWKGDMKLNSDKDFCRQQAIRLFPEAPIHLKKHHNQAEALLLAEWLRRQY
jgi:hypothetical protein